MAGWQERARGSAEPWAGVMLSLGCIYLSSVVLRPEGMTVSFGVPVHQLHYVNHFRLTVR
jgi:hypothetical protein